MTTPEKKDDAHKADAHKASERKPDPKAIKEDAAKTAAARLLGTKTDAERVAEAIATDTRQETTDKVIADRKAAAEARGETVDDKGLPVAREGEEINPLAPPLVAPLTETQPHTGGFLISEARGHRARHQGVVASGAGKVLAGTIMGQITASKKWLVMSPAAVDGSNTAAGILYGDVDATSADKQAAFIVRDAEFNIAEVVWGAGVTTQPQKDAALASLALVGLVGRVGL